LFEYFIVKHGTNSLIDLTLKRNIACTKKHFESLSKVEAKLRVNKVRTTNPGYNFLIKLSKNGFNIENCAVFFILIELNQLIT